MESLTIDFYKRSWIRPSYLLVLPALLLLVACSGSGANNRVTGIYYQVKKGDTLAHIAQVYRLSPQQLAQVNRIKNPEQLPEGSVLFIPQHNQASIPEKAKTTDLPKSREVSDPAISKPKIETKPKNKIPTVNKTVPQQQDQDAKPPSRKTPVSQPLWKDSALQHDTSKPVQASPKQTTAPRFAANRAISKPQAGAVHEKGRFVWPLKGKVANRYGLQSNGMYYNHIRIVAKDNASVTTAASGTVIFSAPLKEFGETVIVKHDQRFATVYTHLGKRTVKVDQRVKQGEQIGLAGKADTKNEGYVHFEIRDHNKSRNPLLFLP